jgi:histone deacetylase 1/2
VCRKVGHDALRCRNRFNHAFQPEEPRARNANAANTNNQGYNADPNWYFDSGATDHLTSDLDRLSIQERYAGKDTVQVANGKGLNITHIGHSRIPGSSRSILLKNVLRVPHISKHLLSMHKLLLDNHAFAEVYPSHFFVKDQTTKELLLQGRSQDGLYPVPSDTTSSPSVAMAFPVPRSPPIFGIGG